MTTLAKSKSSPIKNGGCKIITNSQDSFTTTKEQFWSQRFTKEKMNLICYL